MNLEDIKGCAISIKKGKITILINEKNSYEKITFEDKGKLETSKLDAEQYVEELEKNHPYLYGTKK